MSSSPPLSPFEAAIAAADRARDLGIIVHTITIGIDGHWFEECESESYVEQYYDNPGLCGVGQSVAYLTGGTANRIVGDFAQIEEGITRVLSEEVVAFDSSPLLIKE